MGKEALQWHPAFCSSLQIELSGEPLQFLNEFNLTRKPLQIDVLVIKKTSSRTIQKSIGKIFRAHNIVEFKSPEDYFSMNDFYKVTGYACIYQSNTKKIMEIRPDEITISFVMYQYPKKMVKWLTRIHRMEVVCVAQGVYYLVGNLFLTQIVVIKELSKSENMWLSRLRPGLSIVEDLNVLAEEYKDKKENPLYSTCMDVIMRANPEVSKEGTVMCKALEELMYELYGDKLKAEARELAKELAPEMAKELAPEMAKEMAEELAKEMAEELAKEMAEEMIKNMVQEKEKDKSRMKILLMIELIRKKLQKNCLVEQIADELELDLSLVSQMCHSIQMLSPDSSDEEVYMVWNQKYAMA